MSELQSHHCVVPEHCTWPFVQCGQLMWSVIKNQLIGIKQLTFGFLENFLSPNFQGENMPVSIPLRTPMVLTYHEFKTVCLSSV